MPDQAQTSGSKGKSPTKAAIDNRKKIDLPLDFSFKDITDIAELPSEEVRETQPGKKPERSGDENKYHGTSLKLNNNMLKEITGLPAALGDMLYNPMDLTWIDLSCNELSVISDVFCDFRNLRILYLQGNQIKDIKQVEKLNGMPNLWKLNLHGNPMDREKGYRLYCIKVIPQLQHFDCSLVTKADRRNADCFRLEPKKKKKNDEE